MSDLQAIADRSRSRRCAASSPNAVMMHDYDRLAFTVHPRRHGPASPRLRRGHRPQDMRAGASTGRLSCWTIW